MTDSAGADELVVRRSGGIAGTTRTGRVELGPDGRGAEARSLLDRIDLAALGGASAPQPDRFVYAISARGETVTVGETQLDDDLTALVRLALDPAPPSTDPCSFRRTASSARFRPVTSDTATPAPAIDPEWYSAEAVETCEDVWSVFFHRPTERVRARRRLRNLRLVVVLVVLALVAGVSIWSGLPTRAVFTGSGTWLPRAEWLQLVAFGAVAALTLIELVRPRGSDDPDPAGVLPRRWSRRVDLAIRRREAVPAPWTRVLTARARHQPHPLVSIALVLAWALWVVSILEQPVGPVLQVLVVLAVASHLVALPRTLLRTHRARAYLTRLSVTDKQD